MNPRKVPKKMVAGITVAAAAGLVAAGLLVGGGSSSAEPVSLTLNYSCPFPLIGNQPIKAVIKTDLPKSLGIGEPSGVIKITAITTVPETATQGLTLVGAKTVEGTALASSTVAAPGITLPVNVPIVVAKTNVPATGAFDVSAAGEAPSLSFSQPGEAKITVGDLKLTLTPKTADGAETGLGTFDSACTQVPGQNNLLHTFTIGGTPPTTTPNPTTTTVPPTTTTVPPTTTTVPPTTTTVPPTTTTVPPTTTTVPPTTTTPPGNGVKVNYDITGTSTLKALNGTVKLGGEFNAVADLAAGKYTGDLKLNPTSGQFKLLGFLPVESSIAFKPVGQASGTVATGAITFNGKLDVVLTKISLFGIPIYQGDTCKSPNPTDIVLKSTGNFDVLKGGKVAGTYTLAQTANCGPLSDFIGPFVTSTGNTIDIDLAIKK